MVTNCSLPPGPRLGRPSIAVVPPPPEPTPEVYRDLVDLAPDAMIAVDARTGEIRFVNAQVEHVFGHGREELLGQPVEMLVPERLRGAHLRHRAAYRAHPEARAMGRPGSEMVALHRDGRELPVEVWLSQLPGHDTELVAVAVRVASARNDIQEVSERMRDELISTVSHELRTPLTSILGYTEILEDLGEDVLGQQGARLLEVVRRNAQRELKLVEDMLALAMLGTSSFVVQPQPLNLTDVVRSVLEDLTLHSLQAGVQLWCGEQESVWVDGDAHRLEQVLIHLVGNAIKFTAPGGRVDVRLAVDGPHAVLEVEDEGMGVEPHELPLVFDRLYRTPDVVAAHVPGAGLGLPVVRGIVDAHEGEVGVESRPGHGTTVQVRLPLAAAELAG